MIQRSLGQHQRNARMMKIGVIVNPESRWKSSQADDWAQMVLLYRTTSRRYAREVERELIDYLKGRYFGVRKLNWWNGGGGLE